MLNFFISIFYLMERSNLLRNIEIVALQNIAAGKRRTSVVFQQHPRTCQKNQQFFIYLFFLIMIINSQDYCVCVCVCVWLCVYVYVAQAKNRLCVTCAVFSYFKLSSFITQIFLIFFHIFVFRFLRIFLLFLFSLSTTSFYCLLLFLHFSFSSVYSQFLFNSE